MSGKKYINNRRVKIGCIFPVPKLVKKPKKSRFEKFFAKYQKEKSEGTMSMQLGSDEESLCRTFNSLDIQIQDELSRNSSPLSWGDDKIISDESDEDLEEVEKGQNLSIIV